MAEDRSLRQHWEPGDAEFRMSQCGFCVNNAAAYECLIFGGKPLAYFRNKEKCPERIQEEE